MASGRHLSDTEVYTALKATRGKVYLAAEALDCTPTTIYNHIRGNPGMEKFIESCRARIVDKAEIALEDAVENGDHWAVGLALKTIGKERGYCERQEIVSHNEVKLYDSEHTPDDL